MELREGFESSDKYAPTDATINNRDGVAWLLEVGSGSNIEDDGITLKLHRCINKALPLNTLIDQIYNGIVEILGGH